MVRIVMYDAAGRLVKNLYNNKARIGPNVVTLASNDLSSGVYFVKVEAGFYRETERIIYLR